MNLLGLPRILAIAREHASLPSVYQCFYSRKAFMFPDKQLGPHRDWGLEVEFLDRVFDHGSAYTVGKVNQGGDHWLLYMTNPEDMSSGSGTEMSSLASSMSISDQRMREEQWAIVGRAGLYTLPLLPPTQDYTIEILMTHLSPRARAAFYTPDSVDPCHTDGGGDDEGVLCSPGTHAQRLSANLGIADIFPRPRTQLDAYSFTPCGYSANALIDWADSPSVSEAETASGTKSGEGYYTIHVTPEEGWSYASFECNVPLAPRGAPSDNADDIPDLRTLVRRVVRIFEPGKITMTLFVASSSDEAREDEDNEGETAVEAAQRAFKAALTRVPRNTGENPHSAGIPEGENGDASLIAAKSGPGWGPGHDRVYKRTDKINYEFGGYDLAFASFEIV